MSSLAELGEISKGLKIRTPKSISTARARVAGIQAKEAEKRAAKKAAQAAAGPAPAPPARPPGVTTSTGMNRRLLEWTSPGRIAAVGAGGTAAVGAPIGVVAYKRKKARERQ